MPQFEGLLDMSITSAGMVVFSYPLEPSQRY